MTALTYSFGDSHHRTETYTSTADVDVSGDGHPDGVYLDFDGSGHADSIAWDSDGDGKVDTILVSTYHNGVYDTAYHDPSGNGHWNQADSIHGDVDSAGVGPTATPADPGEPALPPDPDAHHPAGAGTPGTNRTDTAHAGADHTGPDHTRSDHTGTDHTGSDHTWVVGSDDDPYAHVAGSVDEPSHLLGDDGHPFF